MKPERRGSQDEKSAIDLEEKPMKKEKQAEPEGRSADISMPPRVRDNENTCAPSIVPIIAQLLPFL